MILLLNITCCRFFATTTGESEQCFSAVRSDKCFSRKFQTYTEKKINLPPVDDIRSNWITFERSNHKIKRSRWRSGDFHKYITDAGTLYGTNPTQNERQIEAVVSRHRWTETRLELDDNGLIEISLLDAARCASKFATYLHAHIQGDSEIVDQNRGLDWTCHKDEKNSHKR